MPGRRKPPGDAGARRKERGGRDEALRKTRETLEASRDRYAELFERAPVGYVELDEKGHILSINATGRSLLGVSRAQIEGSPFTAFVAQDHVNAFLSHLRRCLKGGKRTGTRVTLSVRDGSGKRPLRAHLTSMAVRRNDGISVRIAFVDLIRQEDERDREIRERRTASLAEFSPVALSHADLSDIAEVAANLIARTLGAGFAEVLELLPDGSRLRTVAAAGRMKQVSGSISVEDFPYGTVLRTREPVLIENRPADLVSRAPHLVAGRVAGGVAVLVPADPDRPYGVLGVYSAVRRTYRAGDIHFIQSVANILGAAATNRRMEETLRETTRTLQELINASPAGILVLDPEGKVLLWNPAMEGILGWTEGEVRGKLAPTVATGQKGARETLERLQAGERLEGVELRRMRKDGRPVDIRIWTAPLREDDGSLKSIVEIVLDVTHLKEMENLALVQEKMATLGQVAAGIAHEIRNPLSGFNIYLANLELTIADSEDADSERQSTVRAIIDLLKKASGRIDAVVNRVMDFSHSRPPRLVPSDINRCIEEAVALSTMALRRTGVRISKKLREGMPSLPVDTRLIEQVILNLITNAAQILASRTGPKDIEVASAFENAHAVILISDSGPGVPAELRDKIFEAFFTTRQEGTGLGLAFSRRVVADHGGTLTVGESALGGAEFRIALPLGRRGGVLKSTG